MIVVVSIVIVVIVIVDISIKGSTTLSNINNILVIIVSDCLFVLLYF